MSTGAYVRETLTVYKTADESVNNSIVLQDDNHLILPLLLNENYLFELHLFVSMSTGGIQLAVNGPALTALRMSGVGAEVASVFSSISVNAYNAIAIMYAPAGAITGYASLAGRIIVSASGNLVLRWAQAVAVANNTTIQGGSWMRLLRIS